MFNIYILQTDRNKLLIFYSFGKTENLVYIYKSSVLWCVLTIDLGISHSPKNKT